MEGRNVTFVSISTGTILCSHMFGKFSRKIPGILQMSIRHVQAMFQDMTDASILVNSKILDKKIVSDKISKLDGIEDWIRSTIERLPSIHPSMAQLYECPICFEISISWKSRGRTMNSTLNFIEISKWSPSDQLTLSSLYRVITSKPSDNLSSLIRPLPALNFIRSGFDERSTVFVIAEQLANESKPDGILLSLKRNN
eukprot:TRINITY_DN7736_c0_g2_i1.p1 TRINITY_DN7736_c0_g2~~TRINITY_DN7736_c0_g2_i1.p1  ORF type:complete len:212 (-),score=29.02 TRINITY_DN7736_c0_g2_i1:3-596(-)